MYSKMKPTPFIYLADQTAATTGGSKADNIDFRG